MDKNYRYNLLLVFFAGVLWSTIGLGVRSIQEANVWQILLYRSLSLSFFLFAIIWLRDGFVFRKVRALGFNGLIASLGLFGAYSGGIYSIQKTSVATAMLLFAVAPLLTAVLGRLVLGERVSKITMCAIALAGFGVWVMMRGQISAGANLSGCMAALASALGFSIFTISLRKGKKKDMLPAVFLSGVIGFLITACLCYALGYKIFIATQDIGIASGMGVFQVGLGLVLYTFGSRGLRAVDLTLMSMAEVVLGPIWVWIALGETGTSDTFLGGGMLIGAIICNAKFGIKSAPNV